MPTRVALCLFLACWPILARGEAPDLALAVGAPVTSIDPHYHNVTSNTGLARHIFDSLFTMNPAAQVMPGLAESWTTGDSGWELHLRPGVKFHDGQELAADDVAFSIARVPTVPNSPSLFSIYTKGVRAVQVIDPHTVRLETNGVYPLLPNDLTQIMIVSRRAAEGRATEDFNAGRAAIGTGPFRFVSYKPGDRVELARNDDYWGEKPAWGRVAYRIITNDAARTAALLSGDVQMIDAVPTSDIARLREDKRFALAQIAGLRIIYLATDQSRDGPAPFVTGPDGEALASNPLKDVRVRRALSLAINRAAIVDRVMEGAATPAGQFLPPGSVSFAAELGSPSYDPAKAKQLLADAGFPKGLRVTLHGPNDRYLNDSRIIQAVGQMWSRIGVQTIVEPLPWTNFIGRASKQEFSLFLGGWSSVTGEGSSPLRALVATYDPATGFGAANRGRYSNPDVDRVLRQALQTEDDPARAHLLEQATAIAMDDVGLIPLHNQKNTWATRAGFIETPRADEETHAMDVRPAP